MGERRAGPEPFVDGGFEIRKVVRGGKCHGRVSREGVTDLGCELSESSSVATEVVYYA